MILFYTHALISISIYSFYIGDDRFSFSQLDCWSKCRVCCMRVFCFDYYRNGIIWHFNLCFLHGKISVLNTLFSDVRGIAVNTIDKHFSCFSATLIVFGDGNVKSTGTPVRWDSRSCTVSVFRNGFHHAYSILYVLIFCRCQIFLIYYILDCSPYIKVWCQSLLCIEN